MMIFFIFFFGKNLTTFTKMANPLTCISLYLNYYSTIRGRIDQVNQVLELEKESRSSVRYQAMDKWANQLQSLQLAVINKMA